MSLYVLGISYKTADIALREHVALDEQKQLAFLQQAKTRFPQVEWLVISTCNRTECYFALEDDIDLTPILTWLYDVLSLREPHAYYLRKLDAIHHFMALLCGLDSMVLGESQIVAQVKAAAAIAKAAGTMGTALHVLLQHGLKTAKHVRHQTKLGEGATSVAYTAVLLARSIFSDLAPLQVLLIGAGDTAELTAWHLLQQGVVHLTVLNREFKKAQQLASKWQMQAGALHELPDLLPQADIIISATASPVPIMSYEMVKQALKKRRRPVYLVDLAMPRDIAPEVGSLEQAYLYNIDDLQAVTATGQAKRQQAAEAATALIQTAVADYMLMLQKRQAAKHILALKTLAEENRMDELQRAKAALARGEPVDVVLETLTHRLSQKLLHRHLLTLKQSEMK